METLIAKRYINALKKGHDAAALEAICSILKGVASCFKDAKFNQIMNSSDIAGTQKEALLLDAVKPAGSEQVNNLMKLLVENGRVTLIPALAVELEKELAMMKKHFVGTVYSNGDIDSTLLKGLSEGLSKRFDATIELGFTQADFDGIKVEVADLGIEINFSKSRLNKQIVEHIAKAI